MLAFTNATAAESPSAETEINHLKTLRSAIAIALALPDQKSYIFAMRGLTQDHLRAHDYVIQDAMNIPHASSILNGNDIDDIIPFISDLGQAYSQLMTHSLADNTDHDVTAIEQAGKLHAMLNFFQAQKAKLYSNIPNEPSLRNG